MSIKNRLLTSQRVLVGGCEEREGPAERAGEQVDQAMERAGEAIEDAGDKAKEKTQR